MEKIKVAAVNYLNTKPLLYGIGQHKVSESIDLIVDYPSKIAQSLINGEVDLGLVPVAVIPKLKEWKIISDFCIGTEGEVASVCIFSEVPIDQIKKVLLDYQSRTSVKLAKLLLQQYWKVDVELVDATGEDFRSDIKGETAGVVIGDRAFEQRLVSRYIYDLGTAWKAFTGLPFVFAAWVANTQLTASFISQFNEANALGVDNIDAVLKELNYANFDLQHYYTRNISYTFDSEKRKGLEKFLSLI